MSENMNRARALRSKRSLFKQFLINSQAGGFVVRPRRSQYHDGAYFESGVLKLAMGKVKNLRLTLAMGDDASGPGENDDGGLAVQESKPQLKPPPMYKVVLLNDDYTPMEFVVEILEYFFSMGREKATQVMLAVHTQGKGVCGIFTRDIAETKAAQVNEYARENQHPLLAEIEPQDD